jgi:DNA (cytosine-5)-methyltransferase 1
MASSVSSALHLTKNPSQWLKRAQKLALALSEHWPKAKSAPPGPVDVIDIFSGCGGMSSGFRAVNAILPSYRLALAVDIDEDSNRSYLANLGVAPVKADVARLARDPQKVRELIKSVRSGSNGPLVMIGCAPCQGFSSHRNAAGENDIRNSLFVAFARVAAVVKPEAIVIENVPEILTNRYWPLVERSREILRRAGYHTLIAVHDMAEFGVPQHRFRAVMIGMQRKFNMPRGFLSHDQFRTVRQAISHLSPIEPGRGHDKDAMHITAGHRHSTIETIKAVPANGGRRPWHAGPDCLRRAEARQGRAAYEDVYGRLWWDRPAITITAYARNPASGRYVHPEQHRGLSVREAALLQGFPDDYYFHGTFDSRFRQIGNAVPPTFAAYLAAHLLGELTRRDHVATDERGITAPLGPSFSRLIPALKAGYRHLSQSER